MGRGCIFYDVTRELLEERWLIYLGKDKPAFTDLRHFFYECRNKFLRENPEFNEIDTGSKEPYSDWQKTVNAWCEKRCDELGFPKDLYWRVREELNIWAEGKAVCLPCTRYPEKDKFLVDRESRTRVSEDCSFILCCEKKTVSRKLLDELTKVGYKVNLLSTGGHSPSDVQEAILEVYETLQQENQNFHVLVLHDYDLNGVQIHFTLAKRCPNIIDCGINEAFLQYIESTVGLDARMLEEKVLNKQYYQQLKDTIEESDSYSIDEFEWLQGEEISEKRWEGRRIEIDAVDVEYGIKPFVDYIVAQINEHCECWDLTKIGVEEFELDTVKNYYEEAVDEFEKNVGIVYGRKECELEKNQLDIIGKITEILKFPEEYLKLKEEYLGDDLKRKYQYKGDIEYRFEVRNVKTVDVLKDEFEEDIEFDWRDEFEEDIDEINRRVRNYCGNVTTAEDELKAEVKSLQEAVEEAAENDNNLVTFKGKLEKVETGADKLQKIKSGDFKEDLKKVIDTLQDWYSQL